MTYYVAPTTIDIPSDPPNAPSRPLDPAKAKENAKIFSAAYALCTILLVFLDMSGVSSSNHLDIAVRWIGSLILLVACLTLLAFSLRALGPVLLPDDHTKGKYRVYIGAMMGVYAASMLAVFLGYLDDKNFICQIFWSQTLALPMAFIVSRYLGDKMDKKEEMLLKFCAYGLVDMLLWLDLQKIPFSSLEDVEKNVVPVFAWMGWTIGFIFLLACCGYLLFLNIEYIVKVRLADNPSGRILTILGAMIGVGIMVLGVMAPFEMIFRVLEDKHWMYQILWAESGALPGAYLIGGSAWFARMYGCQQLILPQCSAVVTTEARS